MSTRAKIIAVIVLVIIIVIIIVAGGKQGETGPIKIGFIDPLSGGAANFGASTKGGYALAAKEINDRGGVDGRMIELVYEDGKCAGKDSASAAQKLIAVDKVRYIVGMICSGEVLSVAPISEQSKVLLFVHGSSPEITEAGEYILRTSPSDVMSAEKIATHAVANKFTDMAIIAENTDYSMALKDAFEKKYTELGGRVVDVQSYSAGTTDFRSILTKLAASKPKALFIDAQDGVNGVRIAEQARALGMTSQFYSAFLTGPEYVKSPAAEGTYVVDVPGLDISSSTGAAFIKKFVELNGTEPSYPFFAAAAYDQLNILVDAIAEEGYDNTEAVRDYIQDKQTYDGVIGTFGFDQNGDVENISLRMVQIKNNVPVELP